MMEETRTSRPEAVPLIFDDAGSLERSPCQAQEQPPPSFLQTSLLITTFLTGVQRIAALAFSQVNGR